MKQSIALSVVVAAERADRLARVLEALATSDIDRSHWELIVVDYGGDEGVRLSAAPFADRIVRLSRRCGQAYACNRGFEASRANIVVFVDPNAAVYPDTLRRIVEIIAIDESADAVYGCYDSGASPGGLASRYGVLLHDFRHRHCDTAGDALLAPCRAFRRRAFVDAQMYDEWRYGTRLVPDEELRMRLAALGYRVSAANGVCMTAVHRWPLGDVLRSQVYEARAPWDPIELRAQHPSRDRARRLRERCATLAVWCGFLGLMVGIVGASRASIVVGAILLALHGACAAPVLLFMMRRGGTAFGCVAAVLHGVHHLAHGARLGVAVLRYHVIGEPRPDPVSEALAEVGAELWPPPPRRRLPVVLRARVEAVDR